MKRILGIGLAGAAFACAAVLASPVLAAAVKPDGPARAVAAGKYECWANGAARLLMNFTVTGPGKYRSDSGNGTGTFRYDPATRAVVFTGFLGEVMPTGFKTVYHEKFGVPTVSFQGRSGSEAAFCERP